MLVHLQFGIPLPLHSQNVYGTSPKTWLAGAVSVPEGIMAPLGEKYLTEQGLTILNTLQTHEPTITLNQSTFPKQYKFFVGNNPICEQHPLYKTLLPLIPDLKPLTVLDYCRFFERATELWSDPELLEFVELLEVYLESQAFNTLKTHYTFINFALK